MADKITWTLGADASQVRAEMASAVSATQKGAGAMNRAWDQVDIGHTNLLRSSHRVSRQITNVSKDLLTGASAGDIFAGSLEGIARSLNISLGALAALGVSAVVGQFIYKTIEDFDKLRGTLEKLHAEASKNGQWQTVKQLEEAAKSAEEAVKSLQARIAARDTGGPSGIGQRAKDFIVDAWNAVTMPGGSAKGDKDALAAAKADQDKIERDTLGKRGQQSSLKAAGLAGAPDYEIKAASLLVSAMEMPVKSFAELAQNLVEVNLKLQELAKTVTEKHQERAGMSLKELADLPDVVNNSVSYERYKASQDAKRALAMDATAEQKRLGFDPEGAHAAFNSAGDIKEGIQDLKPSEKMSADFKGALVVTEERLTEIAKNTSQFVNK